MSERKWISPLQFKVVGNFLEIINKTNTFRFNDMVRGNPRNKYCFVPVSRCSDVWYDNIKSDYTLNYDIVTPLYYKEENKEPVELEYGTVEFLAEDTDSKGIVVSVLSQTPTLTIGEVVQEFKGCFIINQITGAVIAYCILPETVDVSEYLIFSYQGYLLEINNDTLTIDEFTHVDSPETPEPEPPEPEIPIPASIVLTADNTVIMEGESSVLSATVLDENGGACEGVPVYFSLDMDEAVFTGSDGVATCTFDGTGDGDVEVTASCGGFTDTITIEDCLFQDPMTSYSGKWTIPSGLNISYGENGASISASSYVSLLSAQSWVAQPVSLEITVHTAWNTRNGQPIMMIAEGGGIPLLGVAVQIDEWVMMRNNGAGAGTYLYEYGFVTLQTDDIVRIKQTTDRFIVELERNGEITTVSDSEWVYGGSTFNIRLDCGTNRSMTFKDVKLKKISGE